MRTITIILALFLFQQAASQKGTDPYLEARALMQKEQFDAAVALLHQAVEKQPGNLDYIFQRGVCFFNLKQYDQALSDFLHVNKRTTGKGALMLAKTEARLHHPELAMKYLREHLGSYYKLPEKEILLDKDLDLLSETPGWNALWKEREWYSEDDRKLQEAEYLKKNGDYLEAINLLRELDGKGFKRSAVNQNLAEIYTILNNPKAAEDALDKALSVSPGNPEALKMRIDLSIASENYGQAVKDCNILLRQAPETFDYYLVSGRLYSKLDNYERALEQVSLYLDLFPDSAPAMNVLGTIHYQEGKYLDALRTFNQLIEMEKGEPEYFFNRGKTYAAAHTYTYAARDFSMALDLDPKNPDTWFEKGLAELELDDLKSACFSFRKAFQYGKYEASEYLNKYCNH